MSPTTGPRGADAPREFDALCKAHVKEALRIVRRKLGARLRRRVDSEDVLQEVLLEASRLYEAGNGPPLAADGQSEASEPEGVRRWLAAIIENKIHTLARFHLRAKKRSVLREVPLEPVGSNADSEGGRRVPRGAPASGMTASGILMAKERQERLREAFLKLPSRQQEVVRLVHFEKLKVGEAALRMGKTPNATSVLLYEALKRLGEQLGAEGGKGRG